MIRLLAALALSIGVALPAIAAERHLVIELKSGRVVIDMLEEVAPNHVARITALAEQGAYDGVAFHRVIGDFMAQTGDVQYGRVDADGAVSGQAGFGGSTMPDLRQEFSEIKFTRGTVGMARGGHSVDSGNSQFFIMLEDKLWMNDPRDQRTFYTVWGEVIEGMEHVDNIQKGDPNANGAVAKPDAMLRVYLEPAKAG